MKLHILSDLHIEFGDMKTPKVDSDITILAGDTHIGTKGLGWAKNKFKDKKVLYIIGNHEYYHGVIPDVKNMLLEKAKGTNVHVLENSKIIINDIVFLGCTLWSDFMLYNNASLAARHATSLINDYNYIKTGLERKILTTDYVIDIYNHSFTWLKHMVKKYKNNKIVVITHNGPSLKSCLPKFQDDILTATFVNNMEEFIVSNNIVVWIHGHIHNSADYMIGNTRVICNPRGYVMNFGNKENCNFNSKLVIDI